MPRRAPNPRTTFDRIVVPSLWVALAIAIVVVVLLIAQTQATLDDPGTRDTGPLRQLELTPATPPSHISMGTEDVDRLESPERSGFTTFPRSTIDRSAVCQRSVASRRAA